MTNDIRERESALVSLFAIHKTGDPDEIVREAMDSVLDTYGKRVAEAMKEKVRKMADDHYEEDCMSPPSCDVGMFAEAISAITL